MSSEPISPETEPASQEESTTDVALLVTLAHKFPPGHAMRRSLLASADRLAAFEARTGALVDALVNCKCFANAVYLDGWQRHWHELGTALTHIRVEVDRALATPEPPKVCSKPHDLNTPPAEGVSVRGVTTEAPSGVRSPVPGHLGESAPQSRADEYHSPEYDAMPLHPEAAPAQAPREYIVPTRSAEFALKAAGMWSEPTPVQAPCETSEIAGPPWPSPTELRRELDALEPAPQAEEPTPDHLTQLLADIQDYMEGNCTPPNLLQRFLAFDWSTLRYEDDASAQPPFPPRDERLPDGYTVEGNTIRTGPLGSVVAMLDGDNLHVADLDGPIPAAALRALLGTPSTREERLIVELPAGFEAALWHNLNGFVQRAVTAEFQRHRDIMRLGSYTRKPEETP
jgi:hypothetical protein